MYCLQCISISYEYWRSVNPRRQEPILHDAYVDRMCNMYNLRRIHQQVFCRKTLVPSLGFADRRRIDAGDEMHPDILDLETLVGRNEAQNRV